MSSLAVIWAQFGPYHLARLAALKKRAGAARVHGIELSSRSRDYAWTRPPSVQPPLQVMKEGEAENLPFCLVLQRTRDLLRHLGVDACFIPSYWPRQSMAALLAAKSLRLRTVMMNESHAGTAKARGLSALVKRQLVGLFDAGLVGGSPHRRYYQSLGMNERRIFTGYDAVDNDFFSRRCGEVRAEAERWRTHYQLPQAYFLNIGRFVAKKNLELLIRAFRVVVSCGHSPHLVLVGAGESEPALRALCSEIGLKVYDKTGLPDKLRSPQTEVAPGVHFYGFRQIDQTPVFYALAQAFVLPSIEEEWGLVVNEAMASGLPVVVSSLAGCAEDLLELGWPRLDAGASGWLNSRLPGLKARVRANGFLFDPLSVEALSGALALLHCSAEIRTAMGATSARVVRRYSCENFADNAMLAVRAAMGARWVPKALGAGVRNESSCA